TLTLEVTNIPPLELRAYETARLAELAPIMDGNPDVTNIAVIDLEELGRRFRLQKIIFETARDIFEQMHPTWAGAKAELIAQLVRLVETVLGSDIIQITPPLFAQDDLKRRI